MSQWKAGLVAAVVSGLVGFGCGGVEPVEAAASGPSAAQRYLEQLEGGEDPPNQCGEKICYDLERDKNITHVFLDFGKCQPEDFQVFLYTEHRGWEEVTDRLKDQGGPCKELNADYRFEVQGPDREARVCLVFKDSLPKKIRVGAKSGNECRYDHGGDGHLAAFEGDDGGGDGKDCHECRKH
jgi:hypothetical protein